MYELLLERYKKREFLFLFFFSFFVTIVSFILSSNLYHICSGYVTLSLILIPLSIVFIKILEKEEELEEKVNKFTLHLNFVRNFFSIFFGVSLGYFLLTILYPKSIILLPQNEALKEIFIAFKGSFLSKGEIFYKIFMNNLKVLITAFLLNYILGAGALYIIIWNSSIFGYFLGINYIQGKNPLIVLIKILPHGILEFTAYFLSALSGGLLALSLLNYKKEVFHKILAHSILLFVLSVIILFLAAIIEVYI